jgi:tartrate dehydrogenase/decarboxylase/D-malate dehydrogenase
VGLAAEVPREFDQYINLRPVRLFEGRAVPAGRPQAWRHRLLVVRENTEGEYTNLGGVMYRAPSARS